MSKKKLKRLLNRLQEQIEMTDALNSALFDLKCLLIDEANKKVLSIFEKDDELLKEERETMARKLNKAVNPEMFEKPKEPQPELKPGDVCEVVGINGCDHSFAIGSDVVVTRKYESLPGKYECTGKHRTVNVEISQTIYAKDLKLKQ